MPAGLRRLVPAARDVDRGGTAAADALRKRPTSENPRLSCQITSILFDWVFDGAISRITQSATAIKMEYGAGLTRTVHMNMTAHPANIKPSRAGHSIGRWDGDTLVVDTVGFEPGSLAGTLPHSNKLHVVERFTLDPKRSSSPAAMSPKTPSTSRQVQRLGRRGAGRRAVRGGPLPRPDLQRLLEGSAEEMRSHLALYTFASQRTVETRR